MADFGNAYEATCQLEGWDQLTDNEGPGFKTKWGITEQFARQMGYTGLMEDLTYEQAADMAKRGFWDPLKLDQVANQKIAFEIFDTAFNMGLVTGAMICQRAINMFHDSLGLPLIKVDGQIGQMTILALNSIILKWPQQILACLNGEQYIEYDAIETKSPRLKQYFIGWMKRL